VIRRRPDPAAVLWLTVVWVFLWGRVDPAVVLSGVLLGTVMCVLAPLPQLADPMRVRPLPLFALVWTVTRDLLLASAQVTWQIMRPARPRPAVLAVSLRCRGEVMMAMTAIAVSAVPGTTVIDVRREDATMLIHVLDVGENALDTVRGDVWRLERLIVRAFGTAAQVAQFGTGERA
jgi:multicomponent Na+:H+ antiporter subunit E